MIKPRLEDDDIDSIDSEKDKIVIKKPIVLNEYYISLDQDISSPEIYKTFLPLNLSAS
jgi:hypothetical protein